MNILKIIVAVCLLLVVTNAYTSPARAVDIGNKKLRKNFVYVIDGPKDAFVCNQVILNGERITEEKHGKMLFELFTHIYEDR